MFLAGVPFPVTLQSPMGQSSRYEQKLSYTAIGNQHHRVRSGLTKLLSYLIYIVGTVSLALNAVIGFRCGGAEMNRNEATDGRGRNISINQSLRATATATNERRALPCHVVHRGRPLLSLLPSLLQCSIFAFLTACLASPDFPLYRPQFVVKSKGSRPVPWEGEAERGGDSQFETKEQTPEWARLNAGHEGTEQSSEKFPIPNFPVNHLGSRSRRKGSFGSSSISKGICFSRQSNVKREMFPSSTRARPLTHSPMTWQWMSASVTPHTKATA